MRAFVSLFISLLATDASAQDGTIIGRMYCEVIGSRFVVTHETGASTGKKESFPYGLPLTFDYVLDLDDGFAILFGETQTGRMVVAEPFPVEAFRGISRITNVAEFRTPYSELSFGRHRINYKGVDQLYLRGDYLGDGWSGHLVRSHVSGLFSQVVSLTCHSFVDAVEEVLARLAVPR
jgi:hypothetical protein